MKKGMRSLGVCMVFFIFISMALFLPYNTSVAKAEGKNISIVGNYYEMKKTNDTVWGNESSFLGTTDQYKTLGKMFITGELEAADTVDDAVGFVVDGDTLDFFYTISRDRISSFDDTKWHVSLNNGYSISIYTSFNNEDYIEEYFANEDDFSNLQDDSIYQGKDIQLINGCYYQVVVDYMLERNIGKI